MIDEKLLIDRIRAKAPVGLPVVPGTYPVTSFGDVNRARVLTVGINPSSSEFMTSGGKSLLPDGKKRLVDNATLGIPSGVEIDETQARLVLQGNHNYFKTGNHYKWFDDMEKWVLKPLGYSYFDGTAAHVDVLQWATHPVWSGLEDDIFNPNVIGPDLNLLRYILSHRTYDFVLINGTTVYQFFRDHKLFSLDVQEQVSIGGKKRWFRTGHVGPSKMLQWSLNVPHYASGSRARQDLHDFLASKFGSGNVDRISVAEIREGAPSHECPICRDVAIGADTKKVCRSCVERVELAGGQRVWLTPTEGQWTATATTYPIHHEEHIPVSKHILEPGESVWVDGRECCVVMKDPEMLEIRVINL